MAAVAACGVTPTGTISKACSTVRDPCRVRLSWLRGIRVAVRAGCSMAEPRRRPAGVYMVAAPLTKSDSTLLDFETDVFNKEKITLAGQNEVLHFFRLESERNEGFLKNAM